MKQFSLGFIKKGRKSKDIDWIELKTMSDLFELATKLNDKDFNKLAKNLKESLTIYRVMLDAMEATSDNVKLDVWKWAND